MSFGSTSRIRRLGLKSTTALGMITLPLDSPLLNLAPFRLIGYISIYNNAQGKKRTIHPMNLN